MAIVKVHNKSHHDKGDGTPVHSCGFVSMVSKCAKKVGSTLETIESMLIGASVANFDETGTDVNGKTIFPTGNTKVFLMRYVMHIY